MGSSDSGLWCWDATALPSADDAPSQRRGRRGVLASQSEGRVTPRYAKIGGKGTPFPVCLTVPNNLTIVQNKWNRACEPDHPCMSLRSVSQAEFWRHAIAVILKTVFQLRTDLINAHHKPKLQPEASIILEDRGRVCCHRTAGPSARVCSRRYCTSTTARRLEETCTSYREFIVKQFKWEKTSNTKYSNQNTVMNPPTTIFPAV